MKNILVIDEVTSTKVELLNILRGCKINISAVKNEIEAINALFENNNMDAILWVMNSANIIEFDRVKEIRRKKAYINIPIIVVSKYTDKRYIIKAIEVGAKEFIAKPFDPKIVIEKITKILKIETKVANNNIRYQIEESKFKQENIVYTLKQLLNKELKSATRGKYKVSIIKLAVIKDQEKIELEYSEYDVIKIYSKLIKVKLRETDTVYQKKENELILILPFADIDGVEIVKNKVEKMFNDHSSIRKIAKGYSLLVSNASFPEDGKTKEMLLEKVEKKKRKSLIS